MILSRLSWMQPILVLILFSLFGCADTSDKAGTNTTITVWRHQAAPAEENASRAALARFDATHPEWHIKVQSIPQGAYTESLMAASMAGSLPCVLTVDQPMIPSFVWAGHLLPLDGLLPQALTSKMSPIALGRYDGELYGVGQFDGALAVYARRSALDAVGARIPTLDTPWSKEEFEALLEALKEDGYAYPLDIGARDLKADWWTYAFSPLLQSFGGDLIDRTNYQQADGYLNGPDAIAFAKWFHSLFERGFVNRQEPDERGFQKGRNALSYNGNWWAADYAAAVGEDLIILPPPDLGNGPVIGGGSWQWAISATCEHPQEAAALLSFLISTEEIVAMANAASMVPVTADAAAQSDNFSEDGDWRVFYDLMSRYAKERPTTPAFTTISNAFFKAMRDIMNSADPRDRLDDAVDDIEQVIEDNDGYHLGTEVEES